MWGLFRVMEHERVEADDPPRAPLAAPADTPPTLESGRRS